MNYQLTITIKQRKCSTCAAKLKRGIQHFVMSDWPRGADFPTKKNICLDCAPKLTDPAFVQFLRTLLKELEHLETLQSIAAIQPDLTSIYACAEPGCAGEVKYDKTWEKYQCQNLDCQVVYENEDVELLKKL